MHLIPAGRNEGKNIHDLFSMFFFSIWTIKHKNVDSTNHRATFLFSGVILPEMRTSRKGNKSDKVIPNMISDEYRELLTHLGTQLPFFRRIPGSVEPHDKRSPLA